MKKILKFTLCVGFAANLVACSDQVSKQDIGVVTGGVLGGLVGSQFGSGSGRAVGAVAGAVVGAFLGGKIGQYMDKQDRMQMQQVIESAPTNKTTTWVNPDSGNEYSVTPTRTYQGSKGEPCREYRTMAIIKGQREEVYGTACRESDGKWHSV